MTEIQANIPLSSMIGAINPSWGMAVRRFLNPDEWAANTISTQLGDLASQVYELETQNNFDEARKKRLEYVKTAAQGMALPGSTGEAIKQQYSYLNNALDSSGPEAIQAIKNSLALNQSGYGNKIVPQNQVAQNYDPNSQVHIGNAFSRNHHIIDNQSVFNNEEKRKLFNIQRGNENPYSQRTPEELEQRFPNISAANREQYQSLYDILGELEYVAKEARDPEQRLKAGGEIVKVQDLMRKLQKGGAFGFPQVSLPEEIDPIFKKHGLSRYYLKNSSTENSNGLMSNTASPERRSDDEMKQAGLGLIFSKPLTGREQDELGLRVQGVDATEKVRTAGNLALENISLIDQFKGILQRDAGGETTTWVNPQTGIEEVIPAFKVGQGMEGFGEYLKANFNPFGIMQKAGVEESDPGYLVLEKLGKLISDNYLRAASGMQTNTYEAEAFRKILIDGISSGDRTKLWTSVREAEELMRRDLSKAGRDLQSSPYIPHEVRRAFKKAGLNIDPYPTIEEKEEKNKNNLPPPTIKTSEETPLTQEEKALAIEFYQTEFAHIKDEKVRKKLSLEAVRKRREGK